MRLIHNLPKRVAFISVHSCPLGKPGAKDTGGMNVYLRELGKELGKRDIALDIFTRWHDYSHLKVEELGHGVRIIHLHAGAPHPLPREGIYSFLPDFVSELVPFHHENGLRYDLVHSHYWLSGVVGEKLKAVWGVPHVTTFHTLARLKEEALGTVVESPLRSTIEAGVISAADMIITFTEDEKERIARLYGAQAERIRVVPCGVNTQLFRPMNRDEARKALGLSPEDKDILLFVGRMEPLKGLDLLLHMVRCLGHRKGLRLLIVGGDWQSTEEIARLRRQAFELGIYDRVTLWGAVEQERLPLFYAAASVCIVPSYYESFGLVAMEALASGTPVVASCTGGVRDILENGWNGYLVPSRDPWLFARYVESILDHAELGQRMGRAGRASAQQYSWSQVAEGVLSGYKEAMQGFKANPLC